MQRHQSAFPIGRSSERGAAALPWLRGILLQVNPDLLLIIRQALDLPAEARAEFVRAACPEDPEQQARILAEVSVSEREVSRLNQLSDHEAQAQISRLGLQTGLQVGAFKLLRELGAGGMGVVWLAERCDGFSQTVAIKWLHAVGQRGLTQRFERERALLARLQHPNIARILDGGEWQGLPWYAMEYVEGQTLDRYVRTEAPNLVQRLNLMLQICAAVQYAHQNLIVHRDLKPANVLVSADGQVKLLDFGIAKLLDDTDQLTETRAPMTLAYAAPEQIAGDVVTVATDVYALGGLMYEMLTGQRPYRAHSSLNLMHLIANTDPEPPSRVSVNADASTLPPALQVPADLDTITLKALARRPERRYPSVAALVDDLRCFRDGFPISARRDSSWYRFRLWLNRHRLAAALAGLALLSLIGGAVVASVQAARAQLEAERAQRAAGTAEAVGAAMTTLLAAAGPDQNGGVELTVREALNLGSAEALGKVAEQPAVSAALRATLARVYIDLGDAERALELIRDANLGAASEQDRRALQVIEVEAFTALGDYAKARARVDQIDAEFRQLPANHPARRDYLPTRATFEQEGGDLAAARQAISDWVTESRALSPPDPDTLSMALETAADIAMSETRWSEAVAMLTEAKHLLTQIKKSELRRARVDGMLGRALRESGNHGAATDLLAESVAWHIRVLGPDHPQTLTVRSEQAIHFAEITNLAESRKLQEMLLQDRIRVFGKDHPDVAIGYNQLALTEYNIADYAAAADHFRAGLEILQRKLPPEHHYIITLRANLAGALCEIGRAAEALPILTDIIAINRKAQSLTLDANLLTRGLALEQLQRYEEARNDFAEAYAMNQDDAHAQERNWARILLGRAERRLGQYARAQALLTEAVAWAEASDIGCGVRCALANLELSRVLKALQRPQAEVVPLAQRALDVRRNRLGEDHALTEEARAWLASVQSTTRR